MKKFISKFVVACVLVINIVPNSVEAAYLPPDEGYEYSYESSESSPLARKDVVGYVFRTSNGVKQKRLWSYTRGVWVDAYWQNC